MQLYKELQTYDFKGSYRTLCNFIEESKAQNDNTDQDKGAERLEHPSGEAQVDFGVMEAVEDGKARDIRLLIMSFPFSNVAFYEPMPSENQECFLEGLKKLFKKAGGVPRKIKIDNLTPAVKKKVFQWPRLGYAYFWDFWFLICGRSPVLMFNFC